MAPQHPTTADSDLGGMPADTVRAARAGWQRLADQPTADRVALAADLSWQQGYLRGYRHAYRSVTTHLAATAAHAGRAQPDPAGASLRRLAAAALAAADQTSTPPAPPADHTTLTAAGLAAADPAHHDQPWAPVAAIGWAGGTAAGALAGALSAATDVVIDWRARSHAGDAGIHQLPAGDRAAALLAAATRAAVLDTRLDASGPPSPAGARVRAGRVSQPSGTTREVR
jgi:hypothetical protein